jgi:hypothetical protein
MDNTKKGAKTFGVPIEKQLSDAAADASFAQEQRMWELLDADFATLKRESKIEHPCLLRTIERVMDELKRLEEVYLERKERKDRELDRAMKRLENERTRGSK